MAFTEVELKTAPVLKKLMIEDSPNERKVATMVTIMTNFIFPRFLIQGESITELSNKKEVDLESIT